MKKASIVFVILIFTVMASGPVFARTLSLGKHGTGLGLTVGGKSVGLSGTATGIAGIEAALGVSSSEVDLGANADLLNTTLVDATLKVDLTIANELLDKLNLVKLPLELPVLPAVVPTVPAQAGAVIDQKDPIVIAKSDIPEKRRETLNVLFDFDRSKVKPAFHEEVARIAAIMKEYPLVSAIIQGHTCNIGGKQYNLKLSVRRAESIKRYLVENFGIASERISTEGYGYFKPTADNSTREGRKLNRRGGTSVEFFIPRHEEILQS
ncbi:MAG: OmpA family protein [Smithellaceae bacterium]|nr:OmpA family protein [Smithellaceae bacterium]